MVISAPGGRGFHLKPAVEMAAKRHKIRGFFRGRHGDRFSPAGEVKSKLKIITSFSLYALGVRFGGRGFAVIGFKVGAS
jgi:hypothetical protein